MLSNPLKKLTASYGLALFLISMPLPASGQSRAYPDNIRGYKVERTVVEIKKPENKNQANDGETAVKRLRRRSTYHLWSAVDCTRYSDRHHL